MTRVGILTLDFVTVLTGATYLTTVCQIDDLMFLVP